MMVVGCMYIDLVCNDVAIANYMYSGEEYEYELYYSLTAIYGTWRKYNNIVRKYITINNIVSIKKIYIHGTPIKINNFIYIWKRCVLLHA